MVEVAFLFTNLALEAVINLHSADEELDQYADRSFEYISDTNNGSYSSGQINFSGQTLSSKFIVWSDAKVAFTLACKAPSGSTWTSDTVLALKNGSFGVFFGIAVKTTSGTRSINDQQSLYLYNNVRHILENSVTWQDSVGSRLLFNKETDNTNASANLNLQIRAKYMKNYTIVDNVLYLSLEVPLPDIHPMFSQLDFPIVNLGLDINLYVNFGPNTQFSIMVCSDEAFTDADAGATRSRYA